MQNTIQIIQNPEQFQEKIISGVKVEIENLKKEFQPKIPTEYLTRNEVAKMLHIDLSTLHNWVKSRKLKAHGISGRVYFKRSEIEAAIQPLNV